MAVAIREIEATAPEKLWERLAEYGDRYRIVRVPSGENVVEICRENQSRWKLVDLPSEAKGAAITIATEILESAIRANELPFDPYFEHDPHLLDGNDAVDVQVTWREKIDRFTGEVWGNQSTPFIRINVPNALGASWHCPRQSEWLFVMQQVADLAVEGGWLPAYEDDDTITPGPWGR